jgi:predicted phosphodiesterase
VDKTPWKIEAERLAKELPEAQTRTLARRIAKEFGVTLEQARSALRDVRGANGANRRKHASVKRSRGKAGWKPDNPKKSMPESKAEKWTPHVIRDPSSVLILSDIHVPFHDECAVNAAIEFGAKRKPKTVLLNGDTCDFYTISRWIKDPRKRDMKAELAACRQMLEWIRDKFPASDVIFKKGNHEDRWDHWLWNHAPEIADCDEMLLETWLKFDELGIVMVEDERPVMAGKLPIFHGHELPKGLTSPVNMARGAFLRMLDVVLVGHGHRSSSHTEASWTHREITCWSTGCLCDMSPKYARINKWNHGFAFAEADKSGSFNVENLRLSPSGEVRKS